MEKLVKDASVGVTGNGICAIRVHLTQWQSIEVLCVELTSIVRVQKLFRIDGVLVGSDFVGTGFADAAIATDLFERRWRDFNIGRAIESYSCLACCLFGLYGRCRVCGWYLLHLMLVNVGVL